MAEKILANSRIQAVTTNYFDGGRRYAYRVTPSEQLEFQIDSSPWEPFPLFDGCRVKYVAADNNRVFILTKENQLYWRCIKRDSASWVVLIFTLAELIESADADTLIWSQIKGHQKHIEGSDYRDSDVQHWAAAYREWVVITHDPDRSEEAVANLSQTGWTSECLMQNGWNSLEGRRGLKDLKGAELEIIDLAVGNWNNTVITYYVLTYSKEKKRLALLYLDEETIMHEWMEVPGLTNRLDNNSHITASHSVVAVTTGRQLNWMRFDAHQPGHIDVWPLNWTESWNQQLMADENWWSRWITDPFDLGSRELPINPANLKEEVLLRVPPFDVLNADNYPLWHTVELPEDMETIDEFLIDVGYGKRPWPVPEPSLFPRLPFIDATRVASAVWKLHLLMTALSTVLDEMRGQEGGTEIGFLGENPIKPNSAYPVCCIAKSGNRYKGFSIQNGSDTRSIEWRDIDAEPSQGIGNMIRSGIAELCHSAYRFQNNCFRWTNETFTCVPVRYQRCIEEEDQGYEECSRREDRGYQRCRKRRLQCPNWVPGWACNAANEFANLVCVAWTWISNIVCVAWTWFSKIVCVAWEWVSVLLCSLFRSAIKTVCSGIAKSIKWISCWAVSCWETRK